MVPADSSADRPAFVPVQGWARRTLHVLAVVGLASIIVVPLLPSPGLGAWLDPWPGRIAGMMRPLSYAQSWRMYAPDPQRSHTYMNLTAHYPGGRVEDLEETLQERDGWTATWAGRKSRLDIWRYYANFHPKRNNEHRTWYLRAVCIREARHGEVPTKIVMEQVRRGFVSPAKVAAGKPDLGRPKRQTIAWMPCKTKLMLDAIADDRARRGLPPLESASKSPTKPAPKDPS